MRRLVAVLLCLVLLLSFAACTNDQTVSLPSSTDPNPVVPPTSSNMPSSDPEWEPPESKPSSRPTSSTITPSLSGPSSSLSGSNPEDTVILPEEPPQDASVHFSHYCYSKLTDLQKEYYEAMYTAVQNMQIGWIPLGKKEAAYKTDVAVVRNAIANDHPDIFWLPPYYATAVANSPDGKPTVLVYFAASSESEPSYLVSRSQAEEMKLALNKAADQIVSAVTATDPYEKELQLHDLLCQWVEYSDDPADGMKYSAFGALVNKKAVCEGYSRAMQFLLGKMGITAVTVTGTGGGEGHMWNAVNLWGEWYHLDVTWNDTKGDVISREYFNLTDSAILLDHTFSKNYDEFGPDELGDGTVSFNINRPVCKDTVYNYFNKSGFVFFADSVSALAGYLTRQTADVVEVRFADSGVRDAVYKNTNSYIDRLNEALYVDYPDCGFYVGAVSVSSTVLRMYKKRT